MCSEYIAAGMNAVAENDNQEYNYYDENTSEENDGTMQLQSNVEITKMVRLEVF